MASHPTHSKVEILSSSDPSSTTLVIREEDHTLGNAIRHMLLKNPDVEFAGYSIPHPSEPVMHFRCQTHPDATHTTAVDAYERALLDFDRILEALNVQIATAVDDFRRHHANSMDVSHSGS